MRMISVANSLDIWNAYLPDVPMDAHKYMRGYALFWGSPMLTGAIQLATLSARRIGTGVVGVVCTNQTHSLYASQMGLLTLTDPHKSPASLFLETAHDHRVTALCVGPGLSIHDEPFKPLEKDLLLCSEKPLVLDGGCINASWLPHARLSPTIITPHLGEWIRINGNDNIEEAYVQNWVEKNAITVVLKGPQTTVFSPNHLPVRYEGASRYLSTAGTGDILTGLITGLIAQGMPIHQSCAAAVWIHAKAAEKAGPYLLSEDLIPAIWDIRRSYLRTSHT